MKRKLFLLLCTLLTSVGMWAYSTTDLTNAGWSQVTSLPTPLSDYYFVFVDNDGNLMLDYGTGVHQDADKMTMYYRTNANPITTPTMVWTLADNTSVEGTYSIKNATEPTLYLQCEWKKNDPDLKYTQPWCCHTHDNGSSAGVDTDWCAYNIVYANSKWRIQTWRVRELDESYVGPWDNTIEDGAEVAGNKSGESIGNFQIYAIKRSEAPLDFTSKITNPSFENDLTGWTSNGIGIQTNDAFKKTGSKYAEAYEPNGTKSIKQTISGLPAGLYCLSAHAKARGVTSAKIFAGNNETAITVEDKEYDYLVYFTNDGSSNVEIGFEGVGSGTGTSWLAVDNFQLTTGTNVITAAVDMPSDGTVAANKWYKVFIPTAGNYDVTSTNAATIYYSQDGTTAVNAGTSLSFTAAEKKSLKLSVGYLYIRSSAAQTLNVDTRFYLATIVNDKRKWLNKDADGYTYAYDKGLPFTLESRNGNVVLNFGNDNYLNDVGSNWVTKIVGTHNDDWKLVSVEGGYRIQLVIDTSCELFVSDPSTGRVKITDNATGNTWQFIQPETALSYAIADAESHVLGFEAGEYAPYNNTAALAALATAGDATTTDARISAYAALTGATWVGNAVEVNAIYDGDFAIQDVPQSDTRPIGWHRTSTAASTTGDDTGYETRLKSLPDGATSTNKGMMTKFHAFYGEDGVYTLPLKGNTIYELSFKYAGYSDCNNRDAHVNIYDPSNTPISTFIDSKDFTAKDVAGDTSADSYKTFTCHFTTGEAGNYVLGLIKNGGNSNQNQFAFGDIVLKKASVTYLKETFLSPEISNANDIYNSGDNVGEGVFQIPVDEGTTFYEAISDAQAVYDRESATAEEVLASVDDLKDAEETYANATLNAPDPDKAYYLVHVASGLAADLGTPKLNSDASLAYPVYFVSAGGNSYKISKDKTNYVAYAGGNKWTLNTTTTSDNAAVCTFAYIGEGKYSITSDNGSFGTDNTTAGSSIYGDKSASAVNSAWYIYDASANMAVNATAQWGTFCAPFDVAIPVGVSAYTCESATDAGSLNLKEIKTGVIDANTPVILNAESGLASTTFYGKKVDNATYDLITEGLLVGNVSTSTKDVPSDGSAYLLQLHDNKVGFYKANGTGYLIGNNRCYLLGEGLSYAREAFFFEDDATAISALEAAKAEDGALKDGKYMENNRIFIVKNGVKYGANGQKLN